MIGSIDTAKTITAALASPEKSTAGDTRFDAALAAAQKAEQDEQARASQLETIRGKGFRNWVGEMQVEKLKAKLREKIMQAMGLTEEDLAKMAPAIQQILEQKIQQEIEQQLEEEMRQQQAEKAGQASGSDTKNSSVQTAAGEDTGPRTGQAVQAGGANRGDEKSKEGKNCPVIPALAWPGLPPISLI